MRHSIPGQVSHLPADLTTETAIPARRRVNGNDTNDAEQNRCFIPADLHIFFSFDTVLII